MLAIGRHVLTLTVTDDDGLTASNEIVIRVEPGVSEEVLAARRRFLYGYADRTSDDEQDVLYMVDPHQPEAEPRAIPLPIPTNKYLVAAEASPTGRVAVPAQLRKPGNESLAPALQPEHPRNPELL